LNLLCFGRERKAKCYNKYLFNEYVFHTEEYGQYRKTYNSGLFVKRLTSNKFEVDYYGKFEEVIELQYHNKLNKVFFYSNAIGMIPPIDGLEYTITMVWSKLIQRLDFAMSTMSLFLLSNANKFITHTLICLEKIVLGLIDYL